jgi:hypothetical protein
MYQLTIHLADGSSFEHKLEGPFVNLGRKSENQIVIRDKHISGFHAEFRRQPDGSYEVLDLNSHNGIFVNDFKLNRASLKDGDRLLLGVISIVVRQDDSSHPDQEEKPASPVVKRLSPDRETEPAQPAPAPPATPPPRKSTRGCSRPSLRSQSESSRHSRHAFPQSSWPAQNILGQTASSFRQAPARAA